MSCTAVDDAFLPPILVIVVIIVISETGISRFKTAYYAVFDTFKSFGGHLVVGLV